MHCRDEDTGLVTGRAYGATANEQVYNDYAAPPGASNAGTTTWRPPEVRTPRVETSGCIGDIGKPSDIRYTVFDTPLNLLHRQCLSNRSGRSVDSGPTLTLMSPTL